MMGSEEWPYFKVKLGSFKKKNVWFGWNKAINHVADETPVPSIGISLSCIDKIVLDSENKIVLFFCHNRYIGIII